MTIHWYRTLSVGALVLCGQAAFASPCETAETRKPNDYRVMSSEGQDRGYVALNRDGTWFAWTNGVGASNTKFGSRQSAVEFVCTKGLRSEEK